MSRRALYGLVAVVVAALGLAATFVMLKRGPAAQDDQPVQWPFERAELLDLTGRVLARQRELVAQAATPAARERAQSFLRYYERRRAAV
jgi:hypothetical protein